MNSDPNSRLILFSIRIGILRPLWDMESFKTVRLLLLVSPSYDGAVYEKLCR